MKPIKNCKAFQLVFVALAIIVIFLALSLIVNAEDISYDVGVAEIYTTPTIGEENELREITAIIKNYGTENITTEITNITPINVTCTVMNTTSFEYEILENDEMQDISKIKSGILKSLSWNWTPKKIGYYQINIIIDFAIDEKPNNNENSNIAIAYHIFLSENFEEDVTSWKKGTLDTDDSGEIEAFNEWEHGTPLEELVNGGKGPLGAYSGNKCFGTDLDDRYGQFNGETWEGYGKDSAYLSIKVNLTTAAEAKLIFYHWLEIEDSGDNDNLYDKAYVEVSIDEGDPWDELWKNPVAPYPKNETVYRTDRWEQLSLNLDEYSGKSSVIIRWRLQTDYSYSYAGWYIDDVLIGGRSPLKNDAGIESIDSPQSGAHLPPGRKTTITATVKNYGTNELVNCKVMLEIYETISGDPVIEPQKKYVGTVANPIKIGEKVKVIFYWILDGKWCDRYTIHVYTYLTNALDKYIDENPYNDKKIIPIKKLTDVDIAVESIKFLPRMSDRGKPKVISAKITNRGNQEEKFNITLEVKWRQDDTDWEDIEPQANPFMEQIQLDAGEVLDNWNTTYVPEVYAEYMITVIASTEVLSYDYKSGLPIEDPKAWTIWESDFKLENNFMSITFKVVKILWEDDMEWGVNEENGEWTHTPVEFGGHDDWHIEYGGFDNSDFSWRCGQGNWSDPYQKRLYHNKMNCVLTSPQIKLVDKNVESDLGISFWMKYFIEPMDSRGKYLDNLSLEYLSVGGNPEVNDDWEALYIKDYDHSPYNTDFWDARLFWPKDSGTDTSNSDNYPGNEHGWIYQQIIFDETNPDTGQNIFVKENGVSEIDDWLWNGFQFRFKFETDHSIQYTGPWIDNVAVFGAVDIDEPPITKFRANWTDKEGRNHKGRSWNMIDDIIHVLDIEYNIFPEGTAIPYEDDDYNTVWFFSESVDPWDGTVGLSYKWDFNDLVDSDGDGNYVNDDDSGDDRFTMLDDKGAYVTWKFKEYGIFTVTPDCVKTLHEKENIVLSKM